MNKQIEGRIDFMFLFDVKNGNPNGDINFNNQPRQHIDTGIGYVSDVCIKRKIRNFISIEHPELGIYIRQGEILEEKHKGAYEALGLQPTVESEEAEGDTKKKKEKRENKSSIAQTRAYMCENYYDVRAFGAVLAAKEYSCGQVMGPVQISISESFHPIQPVEMGITRVCKTNQDRANMSGATEIGSKWIVPYALYRGYGSISIPFARPLDQNGTGFSEADSEILFEAIKNMFAYDKTASRPMMAVRQIYVWRHSSPLGNAPDHALYDSVESKVSASKDQPTSFGDYTIPGADDIPPPKGVTLTTLL